MRRKADYEREVRALEKVSEDALAVAEGLNRLVDAETKPKTGE